MWLIDRTWKPREGWSRPALTVEDNQHHHDTSQDNPGGIIMAARTPTSFNTRVHDPVPKSATRTENNRILRRPWPRGDARSHSEPGS